MGKIWIKACKISQTSLQSLIYKRGSIANLGMKVGAGFVVS